MRTREALEAEHEKLLIANEERKVLIAKLEDELQKTKDALEVAQSSEFVWMEYAAAILASSPTMSEEGAANRASRMLGCHRKRWPRG